MCIRDRAGAGAGAGAGDGASIAARRASISRCSAAARSSDRRRRNFLKSPVTFLSIFAWPVTRATSVRISSSVGLARARRGLASGVARAFQTSGAYFDSIPVVGCDQPLNMEKRGAGASMTSPAGAGAGAGAAAGHGAAAGAGAAARGVACGVSPPRGILGGGRGSTEPIYVNSAEASQPGGALASRLEDTCRTRFTGDLSRGFLCKAACCSLA